MEISNRLHQVASAVTPGKRLADIGTDHGYVPIYLVKQGICPSALAMDVNKGPLERAKMHIEEEGLSEQIQCRLSDGMMKLNPGEADAVVIAGMGGDLTSRILLAREDLLQEGMELILSPQSEWFKVRHTLHEMGYQILKEWFLKEDGKYYLILKAIPGQQIFASEVEYAYGAFLQEECIDIYREYLTKEERKRNAIAENLRLRLGEKNSSEGASGAGEKRIQELEKEARMIRTRLASL